MRFLREAALTLGALLGIICVGFAIASAAFGVQPLIVRSGSMGSAMPVGSLALATEVAPTDIAPGDVISIQTPQGTRVTHRVTKVAAPSQVAVSVYLKGDANAHQDPAPYVVGHADRVIGTVPFVGYVIAWSQTIAARCLGIMFAALLVYLAFRRRPQPPETPSSTPRHESTPARRPRFAFRPQQTVGTHRARHSGIVTTMVVGILGLVLQQAGAAQAAGLTDTATMTQTSSTGAFGPSIPGKTGAVITASGLGLTGCKISWTAPPTGYNVQLTFLANNATPPANMSATPTTYRSQYVYTSSTLTHTAKAPTDTSGIINLFDYFTVRLIRISDGMVSANFSYGHVSQGLGLIYLCSVDQAVGDNFYTWPSVSPGSQLRSLNALRSGASSSASSSSASSSSASSSSAPSSSSSSSDTSQSPTSAASTGSPSSQGSSATTPTSPSGDSSSSGTPDQTVTQTVTPDAAGATKAPSGAVTASLSGASLTLRGSDTGETVYTTTVQAGSTLTWDAASDILTVHQPDGSKVIVKKVGETWTAFDAVNATSSSPPGVTQQNSGSQPNTEVSQGSQQSTDGTGAATQQTDTVTSVPTVTSAQ